MISCTCINLWGGVRNALRLILFPRICSRIKWSNCTFDKAVDKIIRADFGHIVDNYSDVHLSSLSSDIPNIIWVFWWQGENEMPAVIKECYNSVVRNANGREVRLLTKSNYSRYVQLPEHVERKFQQKIIGFPHYSDMLRLQLLARYGGLWIDAAVFVTKPIKILKTPFFSPKVSVIPTNTPHLSLWVIGIMGAAPNMPLFTYAYEMLVAYWNKYDGAFSYLMFDYFIRYGYEHLPWIKELIDSRPILSPDFFSMRYKFNQEVDYQTLDKLIQNNDFISLTYRIPYPFYTKDGRKTYYAALLNRYSKQQ